MTDIKLSQLIINECSGVPETFEPNQLYFTPDTTDEDISNALQEAKAYADEKVQAVRDEIPTVPTKVSAFENDAGYLTEHQDISGLATKDEVAGKQDKINDLATIRAGASKGATAVQPGTLDDYAKKSEIPDIQIKGTSIIQEGVANIPVATTSVLGVVKTAPNQGVSAFSSGDLCLISANQSEIGAKTQSYKPIVPKTLDYAVKTGITTNTIDLTEDEKKAAHEWLGLDFATKEYVDQQVGGVETSLNDYAKKTELPVVPTKVSAFENDKGYLTAHQDISNLATKEELSDKQDKLTAGDNITIENGVISATGGDASNKLDIGLENATAQTKSTIISWGMPSDTYVELSFVKTSIGTYTYTAPANGFFNMVFTQGLGTGSSTILRRNEVPICSNSSVGHRAFLACECKKGDVITVTVGSASLYQIDKQCFFYAEGEMSDSQSPSLDPDVGDDAPREPGGY